MKNTKVSLIIPLFLFIAMLVDLSTVTSQIALVKANELPTLQILPPKCTIENVSTFFSIDIVISNVTDLYGWDVKIYYLNSIVRCINATEGPFLKSSNQTFWVPPIINDAYNETHGMVHLACTLIRKVPGVNGSGVLATIVFQAIGCGNTTLYLHDTKLADSHTNPIPHTTSNGFVEISEFHDLSVTEVTPLKTIVGEKFTARIMVTVKNNGKRLETFNLTLYANSTVIETTEITLLNGTTTTVTITWNTTGFAKGNYTIRAYAEPAPGEINVTDNSFTDGWMVVSIPGDVDGNFEVDIFDVAYICLTYDSEVGEPTYIPNCDVNDDGIIDIFDVAISCMTYGQKFP